MNLIITVTQTTAAYQMISSDTNSVYNADIEQDFDEAKLEMKCLMKMLKFLYISYVRSSIV